MGLSRYLLAAIWIAGSFYRQMAINTVLQGVVYYLDDILVAGSTREEHTWSLKNVLQKFGLRQNVFFQSKLARILGHVATPAGIHPNDQRIEDTNTKL